MNQQPRKRSESGLNLDRISLLPDSLIAEILSCLNSTKESIRTGTLSKRWEHVWCQIPSLIFNHDDYDEDCIFEFYSSVDKILIQYDESKLIKFQLHGPFNSETEDVESCIRHTMDLKVEDFDINVWDYTLQTGFALPDFFFSCSSFIHLKLFRCYFNCYPVCWKNLKSLSIAYGSFNEDLFQKILSGSPVLEELVLEFCNSFQVLDITNESVKSFVLYGGSMMIDTLQINAPYIKSLTIKGDFDLEKLLLLNMSSVIKVELDYSNNTISYYNGELHEGDPIDEELLKGLILSLSHVKELKVGNLCLKVLECLKAKGFTYPSNVKVEEIDSN